MSGPGPETPAYKLERIRVAVIELGRLAYADGTAVSDWPGEVYQFLGRAGTILDIDPSEYQGMLP